MAVGIWNEFDTRNKGKSSVLRMHAKLDEVELEIA